MYITSLLLKILKGKYNDPHFTNGETKAQWSSALLSLIQTERESLDSSPDLTGSILYGAMKICFLFLVEIMVLIHFLACGMQDVDFELRVLW